MHPTELPHKAAAGSVHKAWDFGVVSGCPVPCRYVKFDTYHPAVKRGLPVTRVISRTVLQGILAAKCKELAGQDVITNGANVVDYEEKVPAASWSR